MSNKTSFEQLLDAGVHFGHLKRKWNPKMAPYIFMEKNGIHIIDLHKTAIMVDTAAEAMRQIARSGRKILFVSTKKQAKEVLAERAGAVGMPFVTERWAGGMLTNFPTIRKAIKKMTTIDKMATDGTFDHFSKREKLQISRSRAKLEKNLGSIADLTRLPAALFIIDIQKEHNAVKEAKRLGIPVFAMVDTCCDPAPIDFVIPSNDDASSSIDAILAIVTAAIAEGLQERKLEKANDDTTDQKGGSSDEAPAKRTRARKTAADKTDETATETVAEVAVEAAEVVAEVTEVAAKPAKAAKVAAEPVVEVVAEVAAEPVAEVEA